MAFDAALSPAEKVAAPAPGNGRSLMNWVVRQDTVRISPTRQCDIHDVDVVALDRLLPVGLDMLPAPLLGKGLQGPRGAPACDLQDRCTPWIEESRRLQPGV